MSIFCTAHPNRFQELLKYMSDVRLSAKRNPGLGWKLYDEQLRLRKAVNPESSWGLVDMEISLMYMVNSNNNVANVNDVSPGYRSGSVNMNLSRRLKCYEFNYEGKCSKQVCQYKCILICAFIAMEDTQCFSVKQASSAHLWALDSHGH